MSAEEVMVTDGDFMSLDRKYVVRLSLPAEDVELDPWGCFATLADALRRGAVQLRWPFLGDWELRWADYRLAMDSWLVVLQVWPPGWGDCPTCQGSGASTDESTGGRCWDCRGGGRLPARGRGSDLDWW